MARVLLAEDDQALKDFISRALEGDGHNVIAVDDGVEALDRLGEDSGFDLLLTDIQMPGVDGIALAKRAIDLSPGTKILLMTGVANEIDPELQAHASVVGLLSKPFTLDQIKSEVAGAL